MNRKIAFVTLAIAALLLAACGGGASAEDVPDTVEYTISMYDGEEFRYDPATLEVWVGQDVTLHFVNMGEKDHEFMVGQDVDFGEGFPNGFETDFFEGHMPVLVSGMAMNDGEMLMPMGDDMAMDDDSAMAMDESDMEMSDDAEMATDEETGHADEDHHGYMVMATQDSTEATITFTVTEDMVGDWEYACFEDDGQHYDDGMKGTLVVHEAPAS